MYYENHPQIETFHVLNPFHQLGSRRIYVRLVFVVGTAEYVSLIHVLYYLVSPVFPRPFSSFSPLARPLPLMMINQVLPVW